MTESGYLDRVRRPEYTGENRCTPCTVVTIAIALGLGALLWLVSVPLAVVTVVTSFGLVYLRGYLVPYTPQFTKRYLPDRVLRWFDKSPTVADQHSPEEYEPIDVSATLADLGVLTECENRDDLCLVPSFQERWWAHIETVRDRDRDSRQADIVDLLGLDGDHEVEERGHAATILTIDGQRVGQWESEAALVADLAADRTLREWASDWDQYHVINRSELMSTLRMFLDRCPTCGAPVAIDQETVESCCRSYDVAAVTCDDCGSRLFELKLTDELEAEAAD